MFFYSVEIQKVLHRCLQNMSFIEWFELVMVQKVREFVDIGHIEGLTRSSNLTNIGEIDVQRLYHG